MINMTKLKEHSALYFICFYSFIYFCVNSCLTATFGGDSAFQGVPFTSVHFEDRFWSPRLKTNREISVPHNYKWCEETGRFSNFAKAGRLQNGKFQGIFFNDSDVYKLLEGIAYTLADHPSEELKKQADLVIDWIGAAQETNGYLNSYYTLVEPDKKWSDTHVKHELYCAGHLTEAAVAYYQATGDRKLLDIAEKFLAHIGEVFGREPGKKVEVPGHEEIELALVKLYHLSKEQKYLDLAKFFIDVRGDASVRTDQLQGPYSQDHKPVREQDEIMGHAVRAMYLYAGVADIAALTGDATLVKTMNILWNDVVNRKMYITGGIGARREGEAFGEAFELPNSVAYCETCAAIGLVLWANRLNQLHGDAQYAHILERALYNGVLSGIGMDGKSFFYVNPLASEGGHHRQPFFDCACCPTNVIRFVPSLPGYQYAMDSQGLIINQYVAGNAIIDHPEKGRIHVKMNTDYPWSGLFQFELTFEQEQKEPFVLKYRVPDWTDGNFRFKKDKGYITLQSNDPHKMSGSVVLPVEIERIVANPRVVADRGRVAIQRGPLVYCFEQCDNEVPINEIVLAKEPQFRYEFKPELLGGMGVISCNNVDGRKLTAIPYYAWDHREPGKMSVWVRQEGLPRRPDRGDSNWNESNWTNSETGEPVLYQELTPNMFLKEPEQLSLMEQAIPDASYCWGSDSIEGLNDEIQPQHSNDQGIPRTTFWPHKGTREWTQYTFDRPIEISQCSVYWFDDEPIGGGCRIPRTWNLQYKVGDDWIAVESESDFGTEKDKWNTIRFKPVQSSEFRLSLKLQRGFSGGILGWNLE
ncbi:MAG: glycoside hydrolase family 127 protein [Thermoguttaceae bacterium]